MRRRLIALVVGNCGCRVVTNIKPVLALSAKPSPEATGAARMSAAPAAPAAKVGRRASISFDNSPAKSSLPRPFLGKAVRIRKAGMGGSAR